MGNILHQLEREEDDALLAHLRSEVARLQALADRRGEIAVDRKREIARLRLTDDERQAIRWIVGDDLSADGVCIQATLRGLLARHGTIGHQDSPVTEPLPKEKPA